MRSLRRSSALLVALFIAAPLLAVPGTATAGPAHVKHPCIEVSVSLRPRHVHVGENLSASGEWDGCGRSVYFRYEFRLTNPCEPTYREEGHFRVDRGVGFGIIIPFIQACRGTYRVTAKAYHDGQLVDRTSRYVHVKP